jgi:hypothetical protein
VSISELESLVAHLLPRQLRLVRLFAEALLLVQEGKLDVRDRLRLVEQTHDLSLYLMRRRAKQGELTAEHLFTLDDEFGISTEWILHGDTGALADRILSFGRSDAAAPSDPAPSDAAPAAPDSVTRGSRVGQSGTTDPNQPPAD